MRRFTVFLLSTAILAQAPQTAQQPSAQTAPAAAPAASVQAAQDSPGDFTGPRSIGTMSEFMLDVVFPTSNEVFYVGRNEQKTEKDWIDLQRNTLMMAEAANILVAGNRAKDKDRWMRDAKLLWDVGNKAYKLAKARDLEGMKALNDELYEACQSCHEHYRPGYRRRL